MREALFHCLQNLLQFGEGRKQYDAADLLHKFGNERDALLYALVFVPDFVEVEGSILHANFTLNRAAFPESFINKKLENRWPLWELERSFNYVETSHMFGTRNIREIEDKSDLLFAQFVAQAWSGRLCFLYPTRRFVVSVIGPEDSGDAYAVSFYEERKESIGAIE